MFKRFLCLFLCIFLVFFPFSLPASAFGIEDAIIEIIIEACKHYGAAACSNIESMNGDEFVEFWTDRTNFDANGLTALMHAAQYKVGLEGGVTIRSDAFDQLGLSRGAYLNKALIHRDLINDIIDLVNNGGVIPKASGDDYGFYTGDPIIYLEASSAGSPLSIYNASSNYHNSGVIFTNVNPDSSKITVFHCPSYPPCVYVGGGANLRFHGVLLDSSKFYIVVDQNTLLQIPYWSSGFDVSFRQTPNTSYSDGALWSTFRNAQFDSNYGFWSYYYSGTSVTNSIVDGVSTTINSTSTYISYWEAMAYRAGMYLDLGQNAQFISPPSNLPADDDGNVVMLIPQGGGDIIYLSPTDYDNYVTNNDIDETTYNDTLNQTTINNIHNIIGDSDSDSDSDSGSGSSGGSFDDSRILGKLDTIIGLLSDIKGIMTLTFNTEPCYDNFFDCFDSLSSSLLNGRVISDAISEISDDQPVVVLGAAPRASSSKSPEPSRAYDQGGAGGGNSVDLIASSVGQFDGFVIDLSWYLDFRPYVFSVFTLIAYAVGLYSIVKSYKSVFGISTFSMGSELVPFFR